VVIDVAASGVNRADLMQRQGHYAPPLLRPE
jgi:NADPH:quinone reductase-like Zn-dependent oxidoreductase